MAGMGGGGAARTAGNSEELAVEWACAVGAASAPMPPHRVTGEADALATLWWRMLSSRSAWEVVVQRFSKRVTGGWGAAGMAEESSFAAGVRAREGANTASDGHSQELRYSAGEAAGADAVLLCGRWRGRAGGDAWGVRWAGGCGGLRPAAAHTTGGAGMRLGPAGPHAE